MSPLQVWSRAPNKVFGFLNKIERLQNCETAHENSLDPTSVRSSVIYDMSVE
jgi:hypothetical protein